MFMNLSLWQIFFIILFSLAFPLLIRIVLLIDFYLTVPILLEGQRWRYCILWRDNREKTMAKQFSPIRYSTVHSKLLIFVYYYELSCCSLSIEINTYDKENHKKSIPSFWWLGQYHRDHIPRCDREIFVVCKSSQTR